MGDHTEMNGFAESFDTEQSAFSPEPITDCEGSLDLNEDTDEAADVVKEELSSGEEGFMMRLATGKRNLPSGMRDNSAANRVTTASHSRANTGNRGPTSAQSTGSFRDVWSNIAPSLKILSPNEVPEEGMDDLEIEDFGDADDKNFLTDSEDDEPAAVTRETTSIFQVAKIDKNVEKEALEDSEDEQATGRLTIGEQWEKESHMTFDKQLQLLEEDAQSDVSLDSEEENELMLEIKNEVTDQIRGEMKGELSAMRKQIEYKFSGQQDDPDADLKHLEPDLRMAIIKMRKLDRILKKKIQKEREVKQQRLRWQKQLKQEIEDMKKQSTKKLKEEDDNTSKYLSLELPPSHSKGIKLPEDETPGDPTSSPPLTPVTPVFPTQPLDQEGKSSKGQRQGQGSSRQHRKSQTRSNARDLSPSSVSSHRSAHTAKSGESGYSAATSTDSQHGKKRKNFIKRNIDLASQASEAVALTTEEQDRISSLLNDLEKLPDISEEIQLETGENPYQITLSVGEGFRPAEEEMKRLDVIDDRLKALMAPKDFASIASTPMGPSQMSELTDQTPLAIRHRALKSIDEPGEEVLRDNKEQRDLNHRLSRVEEMLARLAQPTAEETKLTTEQIDMLIGEYALSVSRNTDVDGADTPLSVDSDVSSLFAGTQPPAALNGPPQLTQEQLQSLLQEAREFIPMPAINETTDGDDSASMYSDAAAAVVMELETHRSRMSSVLEVADEPPDTQRSTNIEPNGLQSLKDGAGLAQETVNGQAHPLKGGSGGIQRPKENGVKTENVQALEQQAVSKQAARLKLKSGSADSFAGLQESSDIQNDEPSGHSEVIHQPKDPTQGKQDLAVNGEKQPASRGRRKMHPISSSNDMIGGGAQMSVAPPMTPPASLDKSRSFSKQSSKGLPRTNSDGQLDQAAGNNRPRSSGDTVSQVPVLPAIDPTGQMTRQSWNSASIKSPKPTSGSKNKNAVSNAWVDDGHGSLQ